LPLFAEDADPQSHRRQLEAHYLSVDLGTHIVSLGQRLSGQVRRERHQLGVPDVTILHGLISDFARCRSPDSKCICLAV
jgi:hypothetical protein